MKPCTLFSLAPLSQEERQHATESQLIISGLPSTTKIPGITLLHQYEVPNGYLLITDYDTPWEENIEVVLLNRNFKRVSSCTPNFFFFSVLPVVFFWLSKVDWINERTLVVHSSGPDISYEIFIRSWGIPYLWPRLRARKLPTPPEVKLKEAKEIAPCSQFALIDPDNLVTSFSKKSILAKKREFVNKKLEEELDKKLGLPETEKNGFYLTKNKIIGTVLRQQYKLSDGFLLITEPRNNNKKISFVVFWGEWADEVISYCVLDNFSMITAPVPEFSLTYWERSGERVFILHSDNPAVSYEITIRPWGIRFLWPRLVARKLLNTQNPLSKQR